MAGESGTKVAVKRRVAIVGAPGVGKQKVREEIARHILDKVEDYDWPDEPETDLALGLLADYRVEIKLAIERAFKVMDSYEGVYLLTHTLFDSLAYAILRLETYDLSGSFSDGSADKWLLTVTVVGTLLRDSGAYDTVIFVRGAKDEDSRAIEDRLENVLDAFEVGYTVVDSTNLQEIEEAARLIVDEGTAESTPLQDGESDPGAS